MLYDEDWRVCSFSANKKNIILKKFDFFTGKGNCDQIRIRQIVASTLDKIADLKLQEHITS